MPLAAADLRILQVRYRERRWLAAAAGIVVVGLALVHDGFGAKMWAFAAAHAVPYLVVHGVWTRTRSKADPALLPVTCALTGIGLLLMLSLEDGTYAKDFAIGSAAGALAIGAASFVDTRRAFWRRRHFAWLAGALAIAAVLFFAGSGPAGSGARVNLDVPHLGRVQPVEVMKLFLVLFMAGYFAHTWQFLRQLSVNGSRSSVIGSWGGGGRFFRRINVPRLRDVLPVTSGVALALGSCFLLRDMGPALVVGCTFLFLYGAARGRWVAVSAGFGAMGAGFWTIYKTGLVPVVAERMSMLLSPWENFVDGGEHLAHAYWAMASGGLTGVGVGRGTAGAVPAAHTDMVLPAVGEELGFVGLLALLALYGVLLTRSLHAARRASGAFGLFLASGISLMLLFQLFLIAGGTTGLAPLSGVVTPFISYGKSSMIVNGLLVGLVASVSRTGRGPVRVAAARRRRARFDASLAASSAAVAVLLAAVGLRALYVQAVRADDWAIRPALVPRQSGERDFVYNPRVYEARRMLGLGTIYDRNGIVLAYDDSSRGKHRVYPLGDTTFYLLGDVERRVKWGASNSLYAEHRYHSYLRGYENHPRVVRVDGRDAVRYDYRELRPLIGPPTPAAARMLARRRELRLTIDARLQARVARVLEELAPDAPAASAVVLDALTGEILASVTVPLPKGDIHEDPTAFDRGFGAGAKPPGSTFKLVTAMAALEASGAAAGRWTRVVHAADRYARRGEPTGEVDMRRALVSSSNVYFAALAREVVGPERLAAAARTFGFRVGGPGLSEAEQVVLLREPDNLRQVGFGQGPLVASPLEVAQLSAAIASGGLLVRPRWLMTSPVDGRRLPRPGAERVMTGRHARLLAEAMRGVVTDRRGTAPLLRDADIPIAGKTGTAEEDRPGAEPVNHAWFTGFAPYLGDPAPESPARAVAAVHRSQHRPQHNPRGSESGPARRILAVAVLVEEGGHGGVVAAPIARAIFEEAADLGIIDGPRKRPAAPLRHESRRASPSTTSTLGPEHLISRADR